MRKRKSLGITALLTCLALTGSRGQEEYRNAIPAADTKPATDIAALNNFADMRLGMMIHWGPCVMTDGEISWSMENRETYESAVNRFAPAKFNADDWLSVARECGAKYFTIVAKHHDGFCLWDTKTTDFNVMRSPMKMDIYIHITKEAPELLVLPDCGGKLVSSSSLSAENTKAEQDETGAIRITSPKDGRTASVSVVRLTMDRVVQGMVKQTVGASYPPSRKDDEPPPAEKR